MRKQFARLLIINTTPNNTTHKTLDTHTHNITQLNTTNTNTT